MKKLLYFSLILILLLISCSKNIILDDDNKNNEYIESSLDFENSLFSIDKAFNEKPKLFSFDLKLTKKETRYGVLLGNYDGINNSINFEIFYNETPRVYIKNNFERYDLLFNEINIPFYEVVNLAFIFEHDYIACAINGEIKQKLDLELPIIDGFNRKMCIGGDYRELNVHFFKGYLYNVSIGNNDSFEGLIPYNESKMLENDNIFCSFNLGRMDIYTKFDLKNKYFLEEKKLWIIDDLVPSEYDYSFAILGDTQIMNYKWPKKFDNMFDYILEKKILYRTKICIGLGDITDKSEIEEWNRARNNYDKFNQNIPYIITRGNHDNYNDYVNCFELTNDYYTKSLDGMFNDSITNSYKKIEINDDKYLIFSLDYGFSDDIIKWVDNVINIYYDYKVIITTHAYLFRDGTTLDKNDFCPPSSTGGYNNGDDIWEKLISKHSNIFMVLCGHDLTNKIVCNVIENDSSSKIQLLINPQTIDSVDANGMVCYLFFNTKEKKIYVRYFSTIKKKYYDSSNQFSILYK